MDIESCRPQTPQTCTETEFADRVYLFYDGELAAEEAESFEKHLAFCDRCQQTISDLDFMSAALEERERMPKVRIAGSSN